MANENHNMSAPLNIAGRLAQYFIDSKLTLLIIIGSVLFGAFALLFTPRTYNPEIIVPVVNITVNRPGSNAEEILNHIVRPLEALMSSIPGVDHTYGIANNDRGIVTVRFHVNENEENSLVKIYNQINSNLPHMPSGTQFPIIQSVSLYDVPLITLTLSSKQRSPIELREMANKILENLRSVPKVGKSWVSGSSPSAVKVWLDANKLAQYRLTLDSIQSTIAANNLGFYAGKLEPGQHEIPLRLNAELMNEADVGNILVSIFNAKPVLLKDVARIEVGPVDKNIQSYAAQGHAMATDPAVTISIARQQGSNGVEIAKALLERLPIVQAHIVPSDIQITITRNYGADADDAVNTLIDHLGIAILAVIAILLLFLGWREASVVTISIPLILFVVLGIGWLSGQTINRITLFALILSLGLLVDDSIVVIENIHRHMIVNPLKNFSALVVNAANEIGIPTIIATFTVILALLPMGYVSGMMGPFMGPIPFNAPLAMLISLLIAYSVVPYLAYRWLRKKADKLSSETREHTPHFTLLHRVYHLTFTPLVRSRWIRYTFYSVVLALLGLVMLQPLWQFIRPAGPNGPLSPLGVEVKMLPDDNVNTFLISVEGVAGTALPVTQKVTHAISEVLARNSFVTDYQVFLGESAPVDFAAIVRGDALQHGSHYAQIRVNLVNKHHRKLGSHEIVQQFYSELSDVRQRFPETKIKLFETPPGPPVRSQMEAALYGPDYSKLRILAESITQSIYPNVYGMMNSDNSVRDNLPEYQIKVDHKQAFLSGFTPESLAKNLQGYFAGLQVGSIHQPDLREPRDILLRLPVESRENIAALDQLLLINRLNDRIPLDKVAKIVKNLQEKPIYTRDQHNVVYLSGEMLFSSPAYGVMTVTQALQSKLSVDNLGFQESQPNDITHNQLFWLGEMRLTLDVFRDLGSAFMVALLLIFLLLTGTYRSFALPFIIMGSIPLTLLGVFPGHWLLHQPFTATSMIGVIALAGIVVRNSLLLIDFIIQKQKQGIPLVQAVIESGSTRLQPILLTALAIILGSMVMLSDPVFGGLAISLIFGTFASTTLTLYIIPLIYLSWARRQT